MSKKVNKKIRATLIISASVFAAVVLCYMAGGFDYSEYKLYDLRVTTLAPYTRPSDDIVLILLDQDSIDWARQQRSWSWPWPRQAYAEIVDYINEGGASSFAFDVIFSEPSLYDTVFDSILNNIEGINRNGGEPATETQSLRSNPVFNDDESFARAASDFGKVVQTVFFSTQSGNTAKWPETLNTPLFDTSGWTQDLSKFNVLTGEIGAQFPVDTIRDSAGVIGNITGKADPDDVFRRHNLFAVFDGKAIPGLAAASLLASGLEPQISYDDKKQLITWGAYQIPVDKNGRTLLRFRGNLERYIPYTAQEILQSAEAYHAGKEPLLPPENFAGKYIFFGYYAPGLFDICTNPISSVYPGVGMHITMLDNLLQQDFIREAPRSVGIVLCLVITVLVCSLVLYSGKIPVALGTSGGVLVVIIVGAFFAYHQAGLWLPMVAPMVATILAFFASTLYNYATEGSQKRFIKSAFSQYLNPTVIDQLLANPERLQLGGERREISIFFSDIQGFTTVSEKLDPTQLTEMLNDYLSVMTDTILDSGGTIDKYEGDAIIAFWNAPLSYKDHAARALSASLACQKLLAERQELFYEQYGVRLLTRIGLNTGYAVVGNMGSNKRFDYTMLGDSVNLAARLEGQNKQFGTYIMCTENTFMQAGQAGTFFGRKLAELAVVGKTKPVTVYEPVSEAAWHEKQELFKRFDKARSLFYAAQFDQALPLFEALANVDKPSFYYAQQCRYYKEHPAEWKGYWQATSK
ncbi:MAG: adenylate/guanylate cyclase domain-containing protein [Spirochaetaceae bacterium]|nr:adenylate/guanylate cyclase domain-containing protein [Spirochaetaceae bacterium]